MNKVEESLKRMDKAIEGFKEGARRLSKMNKEEFDNLSGYIESDGANSKREASIMRNYDVLPVLKVKEAVRKEAKLITDLICNKITPIVFWKKRVEFFGEKLIK